MLQYVQTGLEVLGAISALCGALSHLPLGKFAAVMGEVGLDIKGVVDAVKK